MARKKPPLKAYVESRKKKYKRPYRVLFHISAAPRKCLQPRRTTYYYAFGDADRWQPALFLCPFKDIRGWLGWVSGKMHNSSNRCARKRFESGGYMTLFVHVVRVNPSDLIIPNKRFDEEFIVSKAIRPLVVVPIRYYSDRPVNLNKVAAAAKRVKSGVNNK